MPHALLCRIPFLEFWITGNHRRLSSNANSRSLFQWCRSAHFIMCMCLVGQIQLTPFGVYQRRSEILCCWCDSSHQVGDQVKMTRILRFPSLGKRALGKGPWAKGLDTINDSMRVYCNVPGTQGSTNRNSTGIELVTSQRCMHWKQQHAWDSVQRCECRRLGKHAMANLSVFHFVLVACFNVTWGNFQSHVIATVNTATLVPEQLWSPIQCILEPLILCLPWILWTMFQ